MHVAINSPQEAPGSYAMRLSDVLEHWCLLCGDGTPARGTVTLLRADMDGLPILESNAVAYRSRNDGVMHACGHDGHVAILLAAAKTLSAARAAVPGTLVFCFQPGEEGYAGALKMIKDGVLENPHVDRTFALHLYSGLDVGKIGVRDGPYFASADEFDLTITGKGGHVYQQRDGFAFETQHFPDSPNHPDFPSTILRPGKVYKSQSIYKFTVEK